MIKFWYIYDFLGQKELRMRSQSVQREMPRPTDVNSNILRVVGPNDPALTELQKVSMASRWKSNEVGVFFLVVFHFSQGCSYN